MFNRKVTLNVKTEQGLARLVYTAKQINRREGYPSYYVEPNWFEITVELASGLVDESWYEYPEISYFSVTMPRKLYRALVEDAEKANGLQQIIDGTHPVTDKGIERWEDIQDA